MYDLILENNESGDSSKIDKYILSVCEKYHKEKRALVFAFIISDLESPHVNKVLRDGDYIDALHSISGDVMTIFYLHSYFVNDLLVKKKNSNVMWLELGVEPIDAPRTIQPKQIAEMLVGEKISKTPSVLFFQVIDNAVSDYFIASLEEENIEGGFIELKKIIKIGVNSLIDVYEESSGNYSEVFNLLKTSVEASYFWRKSDRSYKSMMRLKDFLLFWKW